jgi:hypothetical protein
MVKLLAAAFVACAFAALFLLAVLGEELMGRLDVDVNGSLVHRSPPWPTPTN